MDAWTIEQLRTAAGEAGARRECEETLQAAVMANSGQREEARVLFSAAMAGAEDLRVLFAGFQFFFRTGDLATAEELVRRRLMLALRDGETTHAARAHTNLGLVLKARGVVDEARRHLEEAVRIDEALGHQEGIARDLGNLGTLHEDLGSLDVAESLYQRALEISRRIGADEMAAGKLANLGDIAATRGRMTEAIGFWAEAIAIVDSIGGSKWRAEYAEKLKRARGSVRP